MIAPEPVEVDAGNTVLFTCVAYGDSTPNIRWDRQDGSTLVNDSRITIYDELVAEGDVTFVKSIVEICSVDVADAGEYSCFTWNDLGNDTATFDLSVVEDGKPLVTFMGSGLTLPFSHCSTWSTYCDWSRRCHSG